MFWRKKKQDPQVLIAKKDYKKAITILRHQVQESENPELRATLADTLLADRQIDEALSEYKKLAEKYREQGAIVKAIAVYKKILKLRPQSSDVEKMLLALSEKNEPQRPPVMEIETKLFHDLDPDEFQQILKRLYLHRYEKNSTVVKEGEPGDSLFIIARGQVRVLTKDPQKNEVVLANLGEGEFFGEISLLTGKPRTATIITNSPAELLELKKQDYEEIVKLHPHTKKVVEEFHLQRAHATIEAMIQALHESS